MADIRAALHYVVKAEQAFLGNAITVKGKGGKVCMVPIDESIFIELKKLLSIMPRGYKLFVPDGVPTDVAITRLQQYIYQLWSQIQDEGSTWPMTQHGLRHRYVKHKTKSFLGNFRFL